METFTVSTHKRNEFVEITDSVRKSLEQNGVSNGCGITLGPDDGVRVIVAGQADASHRT